MVVMIVEDNPGIRETIKEFLAGRVSGFCECSDGSAALAMYSAQRPDWVLMDIRMKDMDGIAATRAIKTAFPTARVVIVTNYDDPSLRAEAHEAGAAGYVLKDDLSPLKVILR
jgi:DNA-binding NarL/FixJ family response regulator